MKNKNYQVKVNFVYLDKDKVNEREDTILSLLIKSAQRKEFLTQNLTHDNINSL